MRPAALSNPSRQNSLTSWAFAAVPPGLWKVLGCLYLNGFARNEGSGIAYLSAYWAKGLAFLQHAGLFGSAQADQPVDGVRSAVRSSVVMPYLQLTQKSYGQHLDARQD